MTASTFDARFLAVIGFAVLIVSGGFYALVLYPLALDPLIVGAIISMMTTAVNWVFNDQQARSAVKRAQQSFESGQRAANPPTNDGAVPLPEPDLPDPGRPAPNG